MSTSSQLLDSLIKDTEKSISSLESRPDLMDQVTDLEQKYDEASRLKDEKERELRIKVLESDFRQLREMARQEEQDLSAAVFGLNAILEGMGRDYMELGQLNPAEQALITAAESELAAAKLGRTEADQVWNLFGRRTRAIAEADQKVAQADAKIAEAKQEARRRARQRLMSADMEHSLQDFMHRVSRTISIMENRMKEIDKQLKAVTSRKATAFDIKQKSAEALEKLDAELNEKEAELRREEEIIQTLINGTPEHAEQTKKVSNLRANVEELRGRRNTAFVLFQSKEKFAAELEIHEKTQMKLRDNQRMWITSLRSDTEERVTTFRSRLEAMKAMADQDVAKQLDDLGSAVDQANAEYMAMAGAASDRVRMSKIEQQPERVAKLAKVQAHQAEAIQQIRVREAEAIERFKKQYGIDPTKSSFFTYEGQSAPEPGAAPAPEQAGLF